MAGRSAGDIPFDGKINLNVGELAADAAAAGAATGKAYANAFNRQQVGTGKLIGKDIAAAVTGGTAAGKAYANAFNRQQVGNGRLLGAEIQQAVAALNAVGGAAGGATGSVGGLGSSLASLGKTGAIGGATAGLTALAAAATAAAGASVTLATTIATIGLKGAADIQTVELAIGTMKDQLKDISPGRVIEVMRSLSIQSGIALGDISKIEQAFVSLGVSGKGSLAAIETVLSGLAATGGLTIKSFQGVSRALQQIASKPLLQLEELNQIADQFPAVARTKIQAKIVEQSAGKFKVAGDTIAATQERFRLGTQQSGDALNAVFAVMKDLDTSGQALENRTKTLGGAYASFKQRANLALGDVFNKEGGLGSNLAKAFNDIDIEGLATKIGEPIEKALSSILPVALEVLPQVVTALAAGFTAIAPIIATSAEYMGKFVGVITDNKDQISGVLNDVAGAFAAIGRFALDLIGGQIGLKAIGALLRETVDIVAALGRTLDALSPITKTLGYVVAGTVAAIAFSFDGLEKAVDLVNKAITASIQGILDAVGSLLNGLASVAGAVGSLPGVPDYSGPLRQAAQWAHTFGDESIAAVAKTNAALNTIPRVISTTLTIQVIESGSQAGRPVIDGKALQGPGYTDADKKFTAKALENAKNQFKLPDFANTGVGGDKAGAAAAKKAEAAAEAYKDALDKIRKELNDYARKTGEQTIDQLRSNYSAAVTALKNGIEKAAKAGNQTAVKMLEKQLARFRKVNDKVIDLAKRRDALGPLLKENQDKLKALTDKADQFTESVKANVMELGSVANASRGIGTTFLGVVNRLKYGVQQTQQFAAALKNLKDSGLNDTSLEDLYRLGPEAGLANARAILSGGTAGVNEINQLQGQLKTAADGLASQGSSALFDAGVAMAKGIVLGLQSEEAALEAQMNRLADKMVASIKKQLKIKSPSQVLDREVGVPSGEGILGGLVRSLGKGGPQVADATAKASMSVTFGPGSVVAHGATEAGAARMGNGLGSGIASLLERQLASGKLGGYS